MWVGSSLGGAMLHDVDGDAVRRSETAGTRGQGCSAGLGWVVEDGEG